MPNTTTTTALAASILSIHEAIRPDRDCAGDPATVRLAQIRAFLTRTHGEANPVTDTDFADAIRHLADQDNVYIRPVANQQTLTAADHATAVRLGGRDCHTLGVTA
jgi:hypothetical protein